MHPSRRSPLAIGACAMIVFWGGVWFNGCSGELPEPLLVEAGANRVIAPGGNATLEGAATGGTQPYTYSWTPTTALDDPTAAEPTASPVQTTQYTLTATDSLGQTASDEVTVRVMPSRTLGGGEGFTATLRATGDLWGWGENARGQVGDGTTENRTVPVPVRDLTDVIDITGGDNFTVALRSDGTVWAWGANYSGQLGDGTTDHRHVPGQIPSLSDVVRVAAGYTHAAALTADGEVWAWGSNDQGQLGDGTDTNRRSPVRVTTLSNVARLRCGFYHTLAVDNEGTVWAWGENFYGQLGTGTTDDSLAPIQPAWP